MEQKRLIPEDSGIFDYVYKAEKDDSVRILLSKYYYWQLSNRGNYKLTREMTVNNMKSLLKRFNIEVCENYVKSWADTYNWGDDDRDFHTY